MDWITQIVLNWYITLTYHFCFCNIEKPQKGLGLKDYGAIYALVWNASLFLWYYVNDFLNYNICCICYNTIFSMKRNIYPNVWKIDVSVVFYFLSEVYICKSTKLRFGWIVFKKMYGLFFTEKIIKRRKVQKHQVFVRKMRLLTSHIY